MYYGRIFGLNGEIWQFDYKTGTPFPFVMSPVESVEMKPKEFATLGEVADFIFRNLFVYHSNFEANQVAINNAYTLNKDTVNNQDIMYAMLLPYYQDNREGLNTALSYRGVKLDLMSRQMTGL